MLRPPAPQLSMELKCWLLVRLFTEKATMPLPFG